ncbi:unnamed protein product [Bursaphelenchus okinawaensis]|uniref:Inositol-3-phosphate synthase n=1 Tax=Bursaphelenchus okinawaensis TaxID=465554 RepID=A0A811K8F6_9BILA|nr:unnamed protein product [Bursaphelenchus okinawaensis]CAG9095958.1 unnamed protein product [Bursaphelenchus okinawaensis]
MSYLSSLVSTLSLGYYDNNASAETKISIQSPNLKNNGDTIESSYQYRRNKISKNGNHITVTPEVHDYRFRTVLKPRRTGIMLVGLGGNNGTALFGAITANREKMEWRQRNGIQQANYFGSVTQSSTVHLGFDGQEQVHVPFNALLPMVNPNELVVDGWDISGANLYEAALRARVFEPELLDKLKPHMENVKPKPSIYYPDFIASNQRDRADNLVAGDNKQQHLEHVRNDIRRFREENGLETVIVLWTANTERYTDVKPGLNQTADDLLNSIQSNASEISPSNIFAVAAILEGAHYINGSPQNTLVPGVIELAERKKVFVGGDDFKSGQTKLKSALVDFMVSSGIKPESIVSYNHLGNNDGKNLSEERQFRSKEISKSSVVDDMVAANKTLYPDGKKPDHVIVIKYVPYVGDSKRAMDEYISSIFMGGQQTLVIHNTCEDSLLAAPLILDLIIMTELFSRITYSNSATSPEFETFHPVLGLLALFLKAPVVPSGTPVGNAFMKQITALTKLLTIASGCASDNELQLEFFTKL